MDDPVEKDETLTLFVEAVHKLAADLGVPAYRCFASTGGVDGVDTRVFGREDRDEFMDLIVDTAIYAEVAEKSAARKAVLEETAKVFLSADTVHESADWPKVH